MYPVNKSYEFCTHTNLFICMINLAVFCSAPTAFLKGLGDFPDLLLTCLSSGVLVEFLVTICLLFKGGGSRHRRSKDDRDCPPISDPNIEIEVIKPGRDINGDNGATNSRGSVLKVYCPSGFDLNLPKRKIRCKRGEWKPALPVCKAVGCELPNLPTLGSGGSGRFTQNGQVLNFDAHIKHGQDVDVLCNSGYFLNGPSRLRCWYGDWSGGSSSVFGMPKCVGNPCTLPEITGTPGGKYVGN